MFWQLHFNKKEPYYWLKSTALRWLQLFLARKKIFIKNVKAEQLNGHMRRDLLDWHIFISLSEVRAMDHERIINYISHRPHKG